MTSLACSSLTTFTIHEANQVITLFPPTTGWTCGKRLGYGLVDTSRLVICTKSKEYVIDLLRETGKLTCKPTSTPIDLNHKLGEIEEDIVVDREMYQRLVGRLIYISHASPDIASTVSVISQFMHNPKEVHLQAANRVLQYLKGPLGNDMLFKWSSGLVLEAYKNADYAWFVFDRRSTIGYCGNLVT